MAASRAERRVRDPVLIANGQGFWGDSILGPVRLVTEGPLHYLALDYLACGLDPARSILYRQSDLPETCELTWLLTTVTPMGLLQRAHSYKDKLAAGLQPDHGLFARGSNRLYVHRGTGFYGFPLRVGVPGEHSLLELVPQRT